jgi:hypothetical protein
MWDIKERANPHKKDQNDQKNLQRRLLGDKQFGDKGRSTIKVQMESFVPDLSKKLIKAERTKEVVLMHVWLSNIKPFKASALYFHRDKVFLRTPDMSCGTYRWF